MDELESFGSRNGGNEGATGVIAMLSGSKQRAQQVPLVKVRALIPGAVLRMRVDGFEAAIERSSEVNRCVMRYLNVLFSQLVLSASCNRLHSLEQRCARWLLALQDRTGSRKLRIRQQPLADMLGVTRQSAERLLNDFEVAEILDSQRAAVTIKDRSKLHERACACYRMLAKRLRALFV
jgi:CRP-like cAMP-binding protein